MTKKNRFENFMNSISSRKKRFEKSKTNSKKKNLSMKKLTNKLSFNSKKKSNN